MKEVNSTELVKNIVQFLVSRMRDHHKDLNENMTMEELMIHSAKINELKIVSDFIESKLR